jgi:peptidoglycan-N-acetylglucosamine deacetylase
VRVALTIDTEYPDRPCSGHALGTILGALDEGSARATFFVQGRWARSHPADAREIAAMHLLGNHSHNHAPMDSLTEAGFAADVLEAEETIEALTGTSPKPWFRCPFGAGMEDPRVLGRLAELGYTHVGWDVDPEDWHEDNDAAAVERAVLEGVAARGDSIVLLHSWPDATAQALPRILDGLAATGAELVDVGALATGG